MTAEEIKKAVGIHNRILDLVKTARVHNNARPDDDPLWVMCKKCCKYTDGLMIDNTNLDGTGAYIGSVSECVAKYAEICINAGADESDIYLEY